ncbi:hypothetical protein CUJ84_pRLN3000548 (plasmid) [Rhizobium leguminosarum]|uniref:Polyketide cyclase n=1 Tax=Rhizobium leguminosarum TaxID=384 RepID=A0A2K9ZHA8_RHILE|nr:hypothetical protein CUJ84_pRLN3000548 [Rhizobium leguminosarum]
MGALPTWHADLAQRRVMPPFKLQVVVELRAYTTAERVVALLAEFSWMSFWSP